MVVDTSLDDDIIYDTGGNHNDGVDDKDDSYDVSCNEKPIDENEMSDTASIAATDVSNEGNTKVKDEKKKIPKKRGREDRLQTIMSGIVTKILDSQVQSDERYLELEEKRMRLEQKNKEREERMRKDEMDFQLRMMSMLVQSQNFGYPYPTPYTGSFYGHDKL